MVGGYLLSFGPGGSTVDMIHCIKQIIVKSYEYNLGIFMMFRDYKQVYNFIAREKL